MAVKNIGSLDAGIRSIIGAVLFVLAASLQASPLLALAAGFLTIIVVGTAFYRVCPLYTVFGITTREHDAQAR